MNKTRFEILNCIKCHCSFNTSYKGNKPVCKTCFNSNKNKNINILYKLSGLNLNEINSILNTNYKIKDVNKNNILENIIFSLSKKEDYKRLEHILNKLVVNYLEYDSDLNSYSYLLIKFVDVCINN